MPKLLLPEVLSVEEVILHVIDPPAKTATANRRVAGEARGLRLSERALPHTADGPSVHNYFKGHIEKALAHASLRAAVFLPDDGAEAAKRAAVQQTLTVLCADPDRLVGDSERLARRLYELVAGRDVISAADLAVCICRGRSGAGDWGRFVALLKIDSFLGFRQIPQTKGGKTFYTVVLTGKAIEILPTNRQPVQKAAFVRPRGVSDYDLLLLDRQTSGPRGTVAEFFAFDFLGAGVEALGAVPQTEAVYRAILKGRNEARPVSSAEETARRDERIRQIWSRGKVRIEEVARLFPGEAGRRVEEALRDALPAEEVELDVEHARKLTGRRKFRGGGDLVVEAAARDWPDILHRERFVPSKGAKRGYYEIVLHTEKWEEVP